MAATVVACSQGANTLSTQAEHGRRVYQNVCVACHHGDPNQEGTLGPAIAGASSELLEARVLLGEYPLGYTPKRPTAAMPVFPYLEDEIPALAAYLAEVANPGD